MKARVLTIIIALLSIAAGAWAQTYTLEIYDGMKPNTLQSNAIASLVGNGDLKMEKSGNVQTYKRSGTTLFTFNSSTSTISVPRTVTSANDFVSTALNSTAKLLMGYKYDYIALYISIAINSQNFPDANFLSYVSSKCDANHSGSLNKIEIENVTIIDVPSKNISNLKGIEYFMELQTLNCSNNQLTALDVSKNTKLYWLDCSDNKLSSMNLTNSLTVLNCYNNKLTALNLTSITNLNELRCNDNQLTSLNVSGLESLWIMNCSNNQLTSLDLSTCTNLLFLYCSDNQLTSLKMDGGTEPVCQVGCDGNKLRGSAMTNLINSLPTPTEDKGTLWVMMNETSTGNQITSAQVQAAKQKNYDVLIWDESKQTWVDYAGSNDIAINSTNFPDSKFRQWVSDNYDADKDTYLSSSEIAAVKDINVFRKGIAKLQGIEFFTELTTLVCDDNQLTALDISRNTKLTELNCYRNRLTTLNVSNNTKLTKLDCSVNQLTALDVTKNTALTELNCNNNQLTILDVSKNTKLTSLLCGGNQLSAINVSKNTKLTELICSSNQLTTLNVSNCTALTGLNCSSNQIRGIRMTALINSLPKTTDGSFLVLYDETATGNEMTAVQVAAATAKGWTPKIFIGRRWVDYPGTEPGLVINQENFPDTIFRSYVSFNCDSNCDEYLSDEEIAAVRSIHVTQMNIASLKGIEYFTALTELDCYENQLTELDLSKNTALVGLRCHSNKLKGLDVTKNTALIDLHCYNNQLKALDLSKNTALTHIECDANQLTELNLSQNKALTFLSCADNQLTSLVLSNEMPLTTIYCFKNKIQGTSMTALVNSLPETTDGALYVYDNETPTGNMMTTAQVAAAKAKNWTPKQRVYNLNDWTDYEGESIAGDANGDDKVNEADLEIIRNIVLGITPSGAYDEDAADMNGDGEVDIVDLTLLIEMLK